jgi:hypothetical protein
MPTKKTQTLTLGAETREIDQLNVWCKVCGELVAEIKVVHANKPVGFHPTRRQHMLVKINEQIEAWRQDLGTAGTITDATIAGNLEGAQFVMRTIQGLFRDFELEKHPSLLGD